MGAQCTCVAVDDNFAVNEDSMFAIHPDQFKLVYKDGYVDSKDEDYSKTVDALVAWVNWSDGSNLVNCIFSFIIHDNKPLIDVNLVEDIWSEYFLKTEGHRLLQSMRLFRRQDKDRDGLLNQKEADFICKMFARRATHDCFEDDEVNLLTTAVFKMFDYDCDGYLSFGEFGKLMKVFWLMQTPEPALQVTQFMDSWDAERWMQLLCEIEEDASSTQSTDVIVPHNNNKRFIELLPMP